MVTPGRPARRRGRLVARAPGRRRGDDATRAGLFLETSRRMHPDVNALHLRRFYGGLLTTHPKTALRNGSTASDPVLSGSGLRWLPTRAHRQRASLAEGSGGRRRGGRHLIGMTWQDVDGRHLRDHRRRRHRRRAVQRPGGGDPGSARAADRTRGNVGTVDKFQGREGVVGIYSMASSSREDAPRDMSFLYSRNRLNVAISRAQCLALLVASPTLLEAGCTDARADAAWSMPCAGSSRWPSSRRRRS